MNIKNDNLYFLPLGGSGEIGMNCNLYHYKGKWIMVDLGVMFCNSDLEPYDILMPDIDFIINRKKDLSAIILTHAHEDHIGAVPYLYSEFSNIPIYTTSFTASVLKRKFDSNQNSKLNLKLFEYNKSFKIGYFSVQICSLTHSIPEPNAIILKTEKGNIFHTGDWKIDPNPLVGSPIDENEIKEICNDGITAMICDSTNVFNENPSGSEFEVRESLKKIFSERKKGKIIITCFASNIARLETILKVSDELNKCCFFLGRSLFRIYESAIENNYLKQFNNIINEKDSRLINDDDLVIICTGSQGESRAGLSRIVNGNHKNLNISSEDLVIFSSREIPGNEKQINEIKKEIMKIGCHILDHRNSMVHVSGHPSKKELKTMYDWVSPKSLIPVHGEYRHLKEHSAFAKKCGIKDQLLVENGDLVLLDNNKQSIITNKIPSGRKALKGNQIISVDSKYFQNIKKISNDGQLFINIIISINNDLKADPVLYCPTLALDEDDLVNLKDYLKKEIILISKNCIDDNIFGNEIKIIARTYIKKKIGLKPSTNVEIIRI
ncbi:MAG: ribonuclease J [Alphaproteobacteria bacterium]|tara:strand:+ start:766 stop:2415 length:1650 start_codon:yes stop_codon:yes gene_type:complete